MSKQDLKDVQFIWQEILRFAAMDFEQYKRHIQEHSEDKSHSIDMPSGGQRPISEAASTRFWQIAERRLNYETDAAAIDMDTFQAFLRRQFADTFIKHEKPIEQKFVDRMVNKAVKAARLKHRIITHYIPCVIMTDPDPPHFNIGPVRFLTRALFDQQFRAKIEGDYRAEQDQQKA